MNKTHYLMLLPLLLMACEKPIEPAPPPRPALVMKVGQQSLANNEMVLVGEVKSRYESNIGFRIAGKITQRLVDVGATVKKGQLLATIDANDANLSTQAANADIQAAEANYALAKAELDRQRQLFDKQFISKSALDFREAEFKTAVARLKQIKSQSAVTGNQSNYTRLMADRDGVIAQITAEPGQVVVAGQQVAQIIDYQHIEVLVAVPESKMEHLQVGQSVFVKLWANTEKTYAAKVREIAPAANTATRAFDVRVALTDPDTQLKVGMTAGVAFDTQASQKIIIPSTALTQVNGQNQVWVIDSEGVANPRAVTSGLYTEQGVEITSGVTSGEMIAIAGVHTLVKGQKVTPQLASSALAHTSTESMRP
ncbi:MAG: efflux transporter periplasmic adaptor subunit [Methylophilaceae bacterium 17-44-8]|nr:MAG: efflux transporter periplasmic adaptor subunit [Methylophilaceae bacterium 17-44-8]